MKIEISAIHFNADKDLISFINEKVNKLETFYDKIVGGEVTLKVDKATDKENKLAEIRISIPGKDLFAKKQCKSFEEAVDSAVEALRRQLRKHKTKLAAV